ncbi:hypothetical protein DFH29DRAFT_795631 [Suillus ampliporus]|nr:hypothetical protein DFH29DRAFT_795631 [Suillus ampliporus]
MSRAKKLLQKCAYSMISHQELSAQQVCSYLMDFKDHFTSHEYQNLYWTNFETLIDGTQVMDYIYRDRKWRYLSLWDFVAQVEKVRNIKKKKVNEDSTDMSDNSEVEEEDTTNTNADDLTELTTMNDKENENADAPELILNCTHRSRPSADLLPDHYEAQTHHLRIRTPEKRRIPVPIGPALPCRDRLAMYPKYCRLMLILFKPWCVPTDLKRDDELWTDAFTRFQCDCSQHVTDLLDNMQILHECKDSRDDHFANRRLRHKLAGISQDIMSSSHENEDNFLAQDTDEDILTHLNSIDSCRSIRQDALNDDIICCLQHTQSCNLFKNAFKDIQDEDFTLGEELLSSDLPLNQESTWRDCYDKRRANWKKQTRSENTDHQTQVNVSNEIRHAASIQSIDSAFFTTSIQRIYTVSF